MEKKTLIKEYTIKSVFEKDSIFKPQAITLLEYMKKFIAYLETLDVSKLDTKIETETTRAKESEETLQTNIDNEVNRSELAESELQHDIDNHTSNTTIHVTSTEKSNWNTKDKTEETLLYDDSSNIILNYEKEATSNIAYLDNHTLSEFDSLVIYYVYSTNNEDVIKLLISEEVKINKEDNTLSYYTSESSTIEYYLNSRQLRLYNDKFNIYAGYRTTLGEYAREVNNKVFVPYKIIGIKYSSSETKKLKGGK